LGERDEWDQGYLIAGLQPFTTNTSKTLEQVKVYNGPLCDAPVNNFPESFIVGPRQKTICYNA